MAGFALVSLEHPRETAPSKTTKTSKTSGKHFDQFSGDRVVEMRGCFPLFAIGILLAASSSGRLAVTKVVAICALRKHMCFHRN